MKLVDAEQGFIPQAGQRWVVSENRLSNIIFYEKRKNVKLIDVLKTPVL